jgi:gamma-glutamyltranspeptidase/glutathione hydrolase
MIVSATLQTLLALIDFGLPVTAAVASPRIHHQWVPKFLLAEAGIPEAARASLARLGHDVRPAGPLGAVTVATLGPGGTDGAGDPRKGGAAAGP